MTDPSTVAGFYDRHARVYDALARRVPFASAARERGIEALELGDGDVVVDVGCGSGANLARLRRAVGPGGRVLGVDLAPGLLAIARERARRWENVAVVRGDATRLPVDGPVDGVLATFVVGLLDDPAAAVDAWIDRLAPGGRAVTVDAAPSEARFGRLLNPLFSAVVAAGAPPGSRTRRPGTRLAERVDAAQRALAAAGDDAYEARSLLGFLRVTGAERAPE